MDQKQLYRYFRGEATQSEATAIQRWVGLSEENRNRFISERKLFDTLVLSKSRGDIEALVARRKAFPIALRRIATTTLRYAAVVALAFVAGWWLTEHMEERRIADRMQSITVPAGQRINVDLPDGTNVWLNSATTLRYPVSFNRGSREVILDGQAYFKVAHDKKSPFTVETAKGKLRVLGTEFDVLAYSSSEEFETALMEGSVEVSLYDSLRQKLVLEPNTKAVLRGDRLVRQTINDDIDYVWRDGLIGFRNVPLSDIFAKFARAYDIHIEVAPSVRQNTLYSGKFRTVDGVDYALRVLQRDVKFRFERDSVNHVIYIK